MLSAMNLEYTTLQVEHYEKRFIYLPYPSGYIKHIAINKAKVRRKLPPHLVEKSIVSRQRLTPRLQS